MPKQWAFVNILMATVIRYEITGDEKGYTVALQKASQATERMTKEMRESAERGNQAFGRMERRALSLKSALSPLAGAVSQLGRALGEMNPNVGAAVNALD